MEPTVSDGERPAPAPEAPLPLADRELTGQISVASRPVTSRWRPLTARAVGMARGLRPAAAAPAGRAVRRAAGAWRRHPLEGTAVALMGLAGLAYPFPLWWAGFLVWLTGAVLATASRLWDLRDKWVGLVGPLAVVLVGTAMALALGGAHTGAGAYVHEAQTGSLYLIKAGSLLAAGYLAWRVQRGRRSPSVPPWRRGGYR